MVASKHLTMDHFVKLMIITQIVIFFDANIVKAADCSNIDENVPTFKNCQYRCHCVNDTACDENTGECPGGCAHGWMGPGCQYRNIAEDRLSVKQIKDNSESNDNAGKAVDGDLRTCSRTAPTESSVKPYWYITFHNTHQVLGLAIKVPPEDVDNFRMFSVTTGNQSDEVNFPTLCYRHKNTSIKQNMEILCSQTTKIMQLKITLNEPNVPLRLCKVGIYGGRSVSFNKPAKQKSTYLNASLAVDGRITPDAYNICSTTNHDHDLWWRVDLETQFALYDVQFHGIFIWRHENQEGHFYLYYGKYEDTMIELYHSSVLHQNKLVFSTYFPMDIPVGPYVTGRYLQFKLTNITRLAQITDTAILSLCEVLVFAECPKNKCGWDCSKSCHCSTEITGSYKIEGTCPYECSGRWTGVNNTCDLECNLSEWGTRCEKICHENKPCHVITGESIQAFNGLWVPKGYDKWTMVAIVGGPAGAMIVVLIMTIIVLIYRQEKLKRRLEMERPTTTCTSDEPAYEQVDEETAFTELSQRTYRELD